MNTRMPAAMDDQAQAAHREPRLLAEQAFRRGDVPAVRRLARGFAARAGLATARVADFVLAVSEAAASATAWGPCTARVRLWTAGNRAFCEVRGDGLMLRRSAPAVPLAGRQDEEEALRRVVLQQICEFFSAAAGDNGVRVLLAVPIS